MGGIMGVCLDSNFVDCKQKKGTGTKQVKNFETKREKKKEGENREKKKKRRSNRSR